MIITYVNTITPICSFFQSITALSSDGNEAILNRLNQLEDRVKQLTEEVITLKSSEAQQQQSTQVLFYARHSENAAVYEPGATIIFDQAVQNLGGQYDNNTGNFTCPVTGYYMFTTTLNSFADRSHSALWIDGEVIQYGPVTSW